MIPEILITMVGAVYLSRVLDFRSESITRTLPQQQRSDFEVLFSGLMKAAIAAAVIFDVLKIAPQLQGATGTFTIVGLASVDWVAVAVITVICAALAVNFWMMARFSRRLPAEKLPSLRGLFTAIPFIVSPPRPYAAACSSGISSRKSPRNRKGWASACCRLR